MTAPRANPYDRPNRCRCGAWNDSECGCGKYVDLAWKRCWQEGHDAALAHLAERLGDDVLQATVVRAIYGGGLDAHEMASRSLATVRAALLGGGDDE